MMIAGNRFMTATASTNTSVTALRDAVDRARFGGKANNLALALRAGLPVPEGIALSTAQVADVLRGDGGPLLEIVSARLRGPVAVRSSAVDEDGITISFAGQHATVLGVEGPAAIGAAIVSIVASAASAAASAYRARTGAARRPTIAVVLQPMICADTAGVLFTRHPLTGEDQRVIEAGFGLGETVVGGLIEPDRFVVARGGELLETFVGDKKLAIRCAPQGIVEDSLAYDAAHATTLDTAQLRALDALATECETQFGGDQDLEWVFASGALYLLQWRPITVRRY